MWCIFGIDNGWNKVIKIETVQVFYSIWPEFTIISDVFKRHQSFVYRQQNYTILLQLPPFVPTPVYSSLYHDFSLDLGTHFCPPSRMWQSCRFLEGWHFCILGAQEPSFLQAQMENLLLYLPLFCQVWQQAMQFFSFTSLQVDTATSCPILCTYLQYASAIAGSMSRPYWSIFSQTLSVWLAEVFSSIGTVYSCCLACLRLASPGQTWKL